MANSFFGAVMGILTGLLVISFLEKKFPKQLKAALAFNVVAAIGIGLILYGIAEQTWSWRVKNTPWLSTQSEREHAKYVDEIDAITEQAKDLFNQEQAEALREIEQHIQTQKELMDKTESLEVKPLEYKAI